MTGLALDMATWTVNRGVLIGSFILRLSYQAKPTPHASFSKLGSYNPLYEFISFQNHITAITFIQHILLYREGASPGIIILCLIFIGMVGVGLGLYLCLSIVEVGRKAHVRQTDGYGQMGYEVLRGSEVSRCLLGSGPCVYGIRRMKAADAA